MSRYLIMGGVVVMALLAVTLTAREGLDASSHGGRMTCQEMGSIWGSDAGEGDGCLLGDPIGDCYIADACDTCTQSAGSNPPACPATGNEYSQLPRYEASHSIENDDEFVAGSMVCWRELTCVGAKTEDLQAGYECRNTTTNPFSDGSHEESCFSSTMLDYCRECNKGMPTLTWPTSRPNNTCQDCP